MENLPQQITSILALSLAVATVSMTITKAKVSKPLRESIAARSKWLGELFSCPYCFSHWVSFAAVAAVRPVLTDSGLYGLDLFVSALAVIALAAFASGWIYRSIAAVGSSN